MLVDSTCIAGCVAQYDNGDSGAVRRESPVREVKHISSQRRGRRSLTGEMLSAMEKSTRAWGSRGRGKVDWAGGEVPPAAVTLRTSELFTEET